MSAVGEPLPEDLNAEDVPAPQVEPELPPSRDFEREPRYSTLGGSKTDSPSESLPPFLRPKKEDGRAGSESILVSEIRINWLRQRADQLGARIHQEIENPALKKLLTEQLSIARDENIENRKQFDEAERVLNEVEKRINLAQRVRAWSATIRLRLNLLEIAFAMLIIVGLIFLPEAVRSSAPHFLPDQVSGMLPSMDVLVSSMLWGGLGGVFSALVGLQTHKVLEEDVDRNWAIWYLATPLMGIVLGAFLYLIIRVVLLLLFPSTGGSVPTEWVLYVFSGILGFQQNIAYEMVEWGMKLFTRGRR
jgi:hypothetical protein